MDRFARFFSPLRRLAALSGLLLAVACATVPPRPSTAPPPTLPPQAAAPTPPPTAAEKFAAFLRNARVKALAQGIAPETFDRATAGLSPLSAIGQMNANQPEFVKPIWSYLDSAVSAKRIADGKALAAAYDPALAAIEARSGVPKEILVAIWGMETDYGHVMGNFNLFGALATLAYDGPRRDYATPEFFAALRICQDQHLDPMEMTASWAGAFGQTQFTPTTFLKEAVDGDGDGKIDLWHSPLDALASSARLLADAGWQREEPWGFEVGLPPGFAYEDADAAIRKPVSQWAALGVTDPTGAALPPGDAMASVYLPAGARGPAFLLLDNFRVLLKYNNADSYALAVGLLAGRIAGRPPHWASWPRDERSLSRDERVRFQSELTSLGFDTGSADGLLGRRTRTALRQYQKQHGYAADGFPTAALLALLDEDAARTIGSAAP
ncbi:MAG TPA: lytic murein transglycosylase [Rhizomicrobium sp.]|nr:lytic murein transglycosylase [Rhizomicrobium sp.]